MCGLFITNDPQFSQNDLKHLVHRLSFRGPDAQSGIIHHHAWRAYHSRLSILAANDPEFEQPYVTPEGGLLVFNGEILNYKSLANSCGIQNSKSDTEVLASLVEQPGFDLNALEGFFAFVYVDRHGELKHGARDRFGVKPLYAFRRQGYITFSSEASAISDVFDIPYNEDALSEYKVFRSPVFESSYFINVEQIAPGSCIVEGKYFDSLDFVSSEYEPLADLMPRLELALHRSMESRLISDVPVGVLFSGGIDSNIVDKLSGGNLPCFTGGLGEDYDVQHSRNTNEDRVSTDLVEKSEFQNQMKAMVDLRKEPLSVPNEVVLSILAGKWAARGGKVLLSGEGADEFFGGYDRIFLWAVSQKELDAREFLMRYAYVRISEIDEKIIGKTDAFFESLGNISAFEKVRQFFVKLHLPLLFRRLDFALMFGGIEGREPLATLEVFKLAMKTSPDELFSDVLGKMPLRLIAEKYFGPEFAYRKKVGFPIDLKLMLAGEPSQSRQENYSVWCAENMRLIG